MWISTVFKCSVVIYMEMFHELHKFMSAFRRVNSTVYK